MYADILLYAGVTWRSESIHSTDFTLQSSVASFAWRQLQKRILDEHGWYDWILKSHKHKQQIEADSPSMSIQWRKI